MPAKIIVQLLGVVFLVILGIAVAEAVQIVGVLLIFALLVTPAAIAERLVIRPVWTLLFSIVLALLFTWGGLLIAYYQPYSLGFFITALAFVTYLVMRIVKDGPRLLKSRFLAIKKARHVSNSGAA